MNKVDEEVMLNLDELRMKMILVNLLNNAIKYRDQDKMESSVMISLEESKDSWTLSVEDNGLGIAKDHQSRISDMFYRASENSDGSGLGLFIVREAVERLDGEINLKSTVGQGTAFTMRFPYRKY